MKSPTKFRIEGRFLHPFYSPHGEIEGVMLQTDEGPAQVVFDHDGGKSSSAFDDVAAGQRVVVQTSLAEPSPNAIGEHPTHVFGKLMSIDGTAPSKKQSAKTAPAYRGKVVRFNHARHGEANGVVLDSGHFIHTKPEGLPKLKLKIGDLVEADGDAQWLADNQGWAVDATVVNGKAVRRD